VQVSKLKFSEEEIAAVTDSSFFLLKHSITKKITGLFGEMEVELKGQISGYGIEYDGLNISAGKIFRGENYQLYPYILLDYPRLFSTQSVFAFRTMFWWGHEFSYTLHLQGHAFERYSEEIYNRLETLIGKDVYYCINDTPWQYNFEEDNYRLLDNKISREEFLSKPFLKLSRKLEASQFKKAAEYGYETFGLFFDLLRNR